MSNGLAVMIIQHFIPCLKCCDLCKWYFRDVLFYAVGGSALMGLLFMATLSPLRVGRRWRERRSEQVWTEKVLRLASCLQTSDSAPDREAEETDPLLGAGHVSYN